jgi:steroid delta-isomerase-like uncharacterized protein
MDAEKKHIEALLQREAQEIWTEGNQELIPQVYADTQIAHYGDQVLRLSNDAKRQMLASWRGSFPDLAMAVDDILVSGDRAAVRYTVSGTHLGEFEGHAPTGKLFRIEQVYFVRIEDGKIAESWGVWDKYGLYEQLGFLAGKK